ncbi:MAG: glycosyltransferase [Planctomycetota bacterium]
MKIVHLLPNYPPEFRGGIEMYTEAVCAELRGVGEDCLVLAGSERRADEGAIDWGEHEGVRVARFLRRPGENYAVDLSFPSVREQLESVLRDERPDVAHVHHWMNLDTELVALLTRLGIPALVTLHDLFSTCPRFFRVVDGRFCDKRFGFEACIPCGSGLYVYETHDFELELAARDLALRRELGLACRVIAPSRAQEQFVEEVFPGACEAHVLPHGNARSLEPASAGEAAVSGPLRIGFWGNLVDSKGPQVLLDAVRRLSNPSAAQVHLWGGTPDPGFAARLQELADGLSVTFHGKFGPKDLPAIGRQVDVAAFPTLCFESYSFVLDEALLLGLPAIVSERGALEERVGEAGWTVPPGDAAALASLLERLTVDRGEVASKAAATRGQKPWTIGEHVDALRDLYREAIERGPQERLDRSSFQRSELVEKLGEALPEPLTSAAIDQVLKDLRSRYRRIIPPPPTESPS